MRLEKIEKKIKLEKNCLLTKLQGVKAHSNQTSSILKSLSKATENSIDM